jgi:hypothetical protein
MQDEESPEYTPMEECPTCSRKFNENAYVKHVKVCKDVFVKKRKAFDSKAHRIVADEQLEFIQKSLPPKKKGGAASMRQTGTLPKKEEPKKATISKWKI